MKTNDQSSSEKTTYILQWISHLINTPISKLSPSQIFSEGHLITVLTMVDCSYFECLKQLQSPDFLDILVLVEDFIQHVLQQQFKRRVWSDILKKKCFLQLLSLIMYIAVHSENKLKFIPSVLQLSAEAQNSIKQTIQQISSCIESQSLINVTQMLNKIDDLEYQNQTLIHDINEYRLQLDQLEGKYRMLEHDYYFVENQCLSLRKEKSYICKQLDLNRYDDFVEKYRILEQDLDEAYEQLKCDQNRIKQLENTKRDCKARIMDDVQLIEELNGELQTARGLCKSLRMSSGFESPLINPQPFLTSRTLKENIPSLNIPRNNDDQESAQRKKLYNFLNNSQDQLQEQVLRLRNEILQLKQRNQSLIEQVEYFKGLSIEYKQTADRLNFTNKERKNKLMQLEFLYRQFRDQVFSN